jgi:hypothetical protein
MFRPDVLFQSDFPDTAVRADRDLQGAEQVLAGHDQPERKGNGRDGRKVDKKSHSVTRIRRWLSL